MRGVYCSPEETPEPKEDVEECDLNEINTARDWM